MFSVYGDSVNFPGGCQSFCDAFVIFFVVRTTTDDLKTAFDVRVGRRQMLPAGWGVEFHGRAAHKDSVCGSSLLAGGLFIPPPAKVRHAVLPERQSRAMGFYASPQLIRQIPREPNEWRGA
jgi:hypothetical protein